MVDELKFQVLATVAREDVDRGPPFYLLVSTCTTQVALARRDGEDRFVPVNGPYSFDQIERAAAAVLAGNPRTLTAPATPRALALGYTAFIALYRRQLEEIDAASAALSGALPLPAPERKRRPRATAQPTRGRCRPPRRACSPARRAEGEMRAIDAEPFQKAFWADFAGADRDLGAAPMLQWVKIEQLRVDPTYQRDITAEGRRSLFAIARNFDWSKFAPLIVAPIEGGLYAVIDGQHRATAAALRKIESVPCNVVIADQAKQAAAFAAVNGQVTKLSSVAIYHARVSAGDKEAVICNEVCRAADVNVLRYPVQSTLMKRGDTIAPNVILAAIARHGRDTVATALSCVTQTAEGNPGMLGKPVIEALCTVLGAAKEWRDAGEKLLEAFDDFDFKAELIAARVTHHTKGQALNGVLCARLTQYLQQKLPLPAKVGAA
ncbi:ParB N-terminal domain-containing protein [Ancylobacter sp. SL191]|uniref:ParB N-terminal domain-containing protein n=1 Tax=Ancylobacter sp. SL191 TaxID=2995166 RepID=UPI00226E221B|nr:DUF6551 family protein [Ancylobacter sp. SL191]WAC26323.1 ParB N-terminal domain-containing protein [Ancylobacter sp. SL191]